MICPVCGKTANTLYTCPDCWQKIPAQDRRMLGHMWSNRQPTESKMASIVRKLKCAPKNSTPS